MRVYRDFFTYQRGVYKHSAASRSEPSGFHSVRLIGWGEERLGYTVTKYWVNINFFSVFSSNQFIKLKRTIFLFKYLKNKIEKLNSFPTQKQVQLFFPLKCRF